jgi:ABC-type branched-subunit amino acid transport system substrate-binding protein
MIRSRIWRLFALLAVFSLVAVACGDSGDVDDVVAGDDAVTTAPPDTAGGLSEDDVKDAFDSTTTTEEATETTEAAAEEDAVVLEGMDALEAEWAENRAAIVADLTAKIESGEYGIDANNVLRGPGGYSADLNNCPDDWSDTNGLTGDEIRIGHTTAKSGTLAAYGNISVGSQVYFDYVSDNDPVIPGARVNYIIRDDAYVAAQTIQFIDELVESENVFALTTLGSPNTLAVYTTINNECIPHPFVLSGHPAWGDPEFHPWTTGYQLSYFTEAVLWGGWIKANLADELPLKVAGLVADNDFGLAYEAGFQTFAENNPDVVSEFVAIRHDPAAPTVSNEVTTLAAGDPDVFISMTAGNACPQAIQDVERVGLLETTLVQFTPSVCKGIEAFLKPAGDAAHNWWVVGGGTIDTSDPSHADDPFVEFANELITEAGLDPAISLYGIGFSYAWPYIEVLKIGAALPGGLSRTNLMLATWSFSGKHPLLLDGITFAMNGLADPYFIEGSDFSQYDSSDASWSVVGAIVDLDGASGACAWNIDEGGCG